MEDWILPPAVDSSGYPVNPPVEGFQNLGQVFGTASSNAFLAEQEAERLRNLSTRDRIAMANAQAKAEEAAMRTAGQMEYAQLVNGGAKPEEALRRVAHKLYYNAPGQLATALRATRPPDVFEPSFQNVPGGRVFRAGPERAQFIPEPTPQMPPEVKAQQDVLKNKLERMTSGTQGMMADPAAVAALEQEYIKGSTNWMGKASGPTQPTEQKKVTKEIAAQFVAQAKGDRDKARKLAKEAGYTF